MIPKTFSVSQIVAADDCFLKVLMAMQREVVEPLRKSPAAELGRVFHSLMEEAVKGFSRGEEISLVGLEKELDQLLDETRKRLEGDSRTISYVNLLQTMPPLTWERKRRSLLDAAFAIVDSNLDRNRTNRGARKERFCFENTKGDGRWVEVPIHVPDLRLKGRIDLVEREGDQIKLVDLKSGRAEGVDGEVIPKIALQLRLYGILVQALEPKAKISLVVNDGTEHEIPFDGVVAEETKDWLYSKVSLLIPGEIVPAEKCAKVGPECRWCGIRHQCASYLREAPSLWTCEIDWRLPIDTWGTIKQLTLKRNGLFNLTLLDAAGRHVKIFCVRELHLAGLSVGKRVWFFGLAVSRPTLRGKSRRHPLNFYEIGDSNEWERAWALQVFIE